MSLRRNVKLETRMVVGLGNPGVEYMGTRHNVGFRVIDALGGLLNISIRRKRFGAVFGSGRIGKKKLILLKPWKFMNCSGQPVGTALGFYKLSVGDLIVVTDDMALPPGRIRIRAKGSSGGHKGLADIIEKLGTVEFGRLRIGIGRSDEEDATDFVLHEPSEAEKSLLDEAVLRARDALVCWLEYGIEVTMNEFN
ncbi:MAG: aminoacyl-tRNA hydrolase [Planctomycetota bacterium]